MAAGRTYRDLLTYVFPSAPNDFSVGTSTTAYSPRESPSCCLMRSDPDETSASFPDRAIAGLQAFFEKHSLLDQPLTLYTSSCIDNSSHLNRYHDITSESDVRIITGRFSDLVYQLLVDLAPWTGQPLKTRLLASRAAWSQWGDVDFKTVDSGTGDILLATAIEEKKPSVLKAHMKSLCTERHGFQLKKYSGGAESILFNLFLHMLSIGNVHGRRSHTGSIFDGLRVIFAERYHHNGVHGFMMSSTYAAFRDVATASVRPVALLAVLLALALPGVVIEAPTLPTVQMPFDITEESLSPPLFATLVPFALKSDDPTSSFPPCAVANRIPERVQLVVDPGLRVERTVPLPTNPTSNTSSSGDTVPLSPSPSMSISDGSVSWDILHAQALLYRGPEARTWLVHPAAGGRPLVAKVFYDREGMWDQALLEASAIRSVRARCGDITPSVLGLYRWQGEEGGLILQEYGGVKLAGETFRELPPDERDTTWAISNVLHSHGMLHGDLAPHNFVRAPDGVIRILDFGRADMQHQCPGPDLCEELLFLKEDSAPA